VPATAATPEIVSGSAGRLVPRLLILAVLILTTLVLALPAGDPVLRTRPP